MTEYVTPNIHTVLKKYQTTAPKSLQGPGHALAAATAAAVAAGCPPGSNCPLDVVSGVGHGSGNGHSTNTTTDLSHAAARNLCTNSGASNSVVSHAPLSGGVIGGSAKPLLSASVNATSVSTPAVPLIKKEILSSPEPHELNAEALPLSLALQSSHTPHSLAATQSAAVPPPQSTLPPNIIKIVPPPPPELSQPIFTAADSGCGVLYETRLEGKTIGCFSLGGELRLCLPQFLNNVLADFTLDQINRIFDELGIYCSQCTPDQLLEFKAAKILPPDVKASGLITRTDAERLCSALLHRADRNTYISDDDIPKGAISFKVYHRCFGKSEGICTPDLYSYAKPTCIMCLECKGWYSPQKFVGHVHRKVENRTVHWGFDSRKWHGYLHVALDVENREKYQKILDELKEVEMKEEHKEEVKAQHELHYMKRKAEMLMDDPLLGLPMGHAHAGLAPPPHHQTLPLSDKQRAEMLEIPTKKAKSLEDAPAFQLEYQRYHSLMYAHCAQQQRLGQMSAFHPWAPPKALLHIATAQYNAVAPFTTLPYLSQEPPVLQNPERVVRSTDRERFERTYQPNVALVPRKNVLAKEREKEQREYRERERERELERIREREQEREQERSRERERERNREREREREKEQRELERERERRERDRELQQQHHMQQQQQQQKLQQQQAQLQQHQQHMVALSSNLCTATTELHIKQERANTPTDLSESPPPTRVSLAADEDPVDRRSTGSMDEDTTLPMISPMALSMSQQQQQRKLNASNNSNSSSNVELLQQQQQQRRHSLYTSNSSACSTSSSSNASTTPPQQQQLLPAHLPPPNQQQKRQLQQLAMQQQQQQTSHQRQSPRTASPSPTNTRSPEEFSGSNEITSSTSPAPCNENNSNSINKNSHSRQSHATGQTTIATVNQHAKLLPTPISATFTASSNSSNNSSSSSSNNNNEVPSRIRISKNLINQSNIMRSPTPPLPLPPPTSHFNHQHHLPHHAHHHHQQQQLLQHHQQQYEYFKQSQRLFEQQQQLQQQSQQTTHALLRQSQQHSPTQSSATAGLNLSTHAAKTTARQSTTDASQQKQQQHTHRSHNGLPHVGSEFELSTDTDDDSINGEPDSSNALPPWEMAVDALRDSRPKDRERVLNLLRRLLQENQQLRYNNMQLSEMVHKRDLLIRELREQLQRQQRQCHLDAISVPQNAVSQPQPNGALVEHGGLRAKMDCCQDVEMRVLPLKKLHRRELERDNETTAVDTTTTATTEDNSVTPPVRLESKDIVNGRQHDDSDNDDDMNDIVADGDGNGCVDVQRDVVGAGAGNDEDDNTNDAAGRDDDDTLAAPQAKRIKCENVDQQNVENAIEAHKMQRRISHEIRRDEQGNSSDSDTEDDTNSHKGAGIAGNQSDDKLNHSKNSPINADTNATNDDADEDDSRSSIDNNSESEVDCRFEADGDSRANSIGNNVDNDAVTIADADSDAEAEVNADSDNDDDSRSDIHTHNQEHGVQAPHSSALATPPTATTPISPDSAATAGQLFDSSNSSDDASMKKAQMSASNALAKISSDQNDEDDESNDRDAGAKHDTITIAELNLSEADDSDSADHDSCAAAATKRRLSPREAVKYSKRIADAASKDNRYATRNNNNKSNMPTAATTTTTPSILTTGSNGEQTTTTQRTPLPTKASKKLTPAVPNCELQHIKKELI